MKKPFVRLLLALFLISCASPTVTIPATNTTVVPVPAITSTAGIPSLSNPGEVALSHVQAIANEIGPRYVQVSPEYGENGKIWHTQYDTLEYIETRFPGRIQERLDLFIIVLEGGLTEYKVP